MNRIVVDDALIVQLGGLQVPVTLCDKHGNALAHLSPVYDRAFYETLATTSPNDEEELTKREQEVGGRSLQEILADLNSNHN